MPRPNRTAERRRAVLPEVAAVFAELGYRGATTAELARRCGLRENQLYRLWPDKQAMFIASIDWLFDASIERWRALLDEAEAETASGGVQRSAAERILAAEALNRGETGLYRIIFAALSETVEPRVRAALRRMYRRFHGFIAERVAEHRGGQGADEATVAGVAWAVIGVATMADITRELRLMPRDDRQSMLESCGTVLLNGPGKS